MSLFHLQARLLSWDQCILWKSRCITVFGLGLSNCIWVHSLKYSYWFKKGKQEISPCRSTTEPLKTRFRQILIPLYYTTYNGNIKEHFCCVVLVILCHRSGLHYPKRRPVNCPWWVTQLASSSTFHFCLCHVPTIVHTLSSYKALQSEKQLFYDSRDRWSCPERSVIVIL